MSSIGRVLALREVEQRLPGRRSARRLHDRSSRGRSDHAQLGGRHPFSTADDQRRLRGRAATPIRCAASDVQDGLDLSPIDPGVVLAVDNIAVEGIYPDVRALLRMGRAMVDLYYRSPFTPRFPNGSRWISTTRFDAAHEVQRLRLFNAHYDEYLDFGRSSCSTARAASSPPCFIHAKRPSSKKIKPFPEASVARDPLAEPGTARSCCGPTAIIAAPGSRLVSRRRPSATSSASAPTDDVAPPCREEVLESQHDGGIRGRSRGAASCVVFQGIFRWRAKLEPGRGGSSPASKRAPEEPDTRFVVTNLSKRNARGLYRSQCQPLPARPGRKPYQVLEDPSGGGSARPSSRATANQFRAVPACGRVLADVGPSRVVHGVRCGASPSSTRCASASSRSPPASSR